MIQVNASTPHLFASSLAATAILVTGINIATALM